MSGDSDSSSHCMRARQKRLVEIPPKNFLSHWKSQLGWMVVIIETGIRVDLNNGAARGFKRNPRVLVNNVYTRQPCAYQLRGRARRLNNCCAEAVVRRNVLSGAIV